MIFKGEHGQNHDCKRPDPSYKMSLYQRNNLFKRSFNDKIYIVSMGMNAKFKVDSHFSNAQPSIHLSYFEDDISCWKFYLVQYQISMTRENFRVHTF